MRLLRAGPLLCQVELPRVVKDLRSMHIVRVAAGGSHTLALSATGGVFSCGNGSFGALGRGTTDGEQAVGLNTQRRSAPAWRLQRALRHPCFAQATQRQAACSGKLLPTGLRL